MLRECNEAYEYLQMARLALESYEPYTCFDHIYRACKILLDYGVDVSEDILDLLHQSQNPNWYTYLEEGFIMISVLEETIDELEGLILYVK